MPKRKLDPLPAAAFQILLSLADQDLHGYGIMRQVAEQTDGRMRLGPGTLYSSIQSLLEESLIREVDGDAVDGDQRRRCYRLTSAGLKLARTEADRLAALLRVARAKAWGVRVAGWTDLRLRRFCRHFWESQDLRLVLVVETRRTAGR